MALLNSYMGVMLAVFGCLLTTLLVLHRNKSAQYEAAHRARMSDLQDAFNRQHNVLQRDLQSVHDQIDKFSQFHNESFSLLSDRIEQSDAATQNAIDHLKQKMLPVIEEGVSALDAKVQQTQNTVTDVINTADQKLSGSLESLALTFEQQSQNQLQALQRFEVNAEQHAETLKNQQHKQMQELRHLGSVFSKTGQSLSSAINIEANRTRDTATHLASDLKAALNLHYQHHDDGLREHAEQLASAQTAMVQHQEQRHQALQATLLGAHQKTEQAIIDAFSSRITHYAQVVSALQDSLKQQLTQQVGSLYEQMKQDADTSRDQEAQLKYLLGKQLASTSELTQSLQKSSETTQHSISESFGNIRNLLDGMKASMQEVHADLNAQNRASNTEAEKRHQGVIHALDTLESASSDQFKALTEYYDGVKHELLQHLSDHDLAGQELLHKGIEKNLSQLDENTRTIIEGIQEATQHTETTTKKAVCATEEKLTADIQAIGSALQQASDSLEQHTYEASERNIAAVTDAYDSLYGLVESEANTTQSGLQALGTSVEELVGDTEERYLEALKTASEKSVQSSEDGRDVLISSLQQLESSLRTAIADTENVIHTGQQEACQAASRAQKQIEETLAHQTTVTAQQLAAITETSAQVHERLGGDNALVLDGLQNVSSGIQSAVKRIEEAVKSENQALCQSVLDSQQQLQDALSQQENLTLEQLSAVVSDASEQVQKRLADNDTILAEVRALPELLKEQLQALAPVPAALAEPLPEAAEPENETSGEPEPEPEPEGEVVQDTDEAITVLFNGKIQQVTDKISGMETFFDYEDGVCRKARSYLGGKLRYEVHFDANGKMTSSTEFDGQGRDKSAYSYNSFGEVEKFEDLR